MAQKNKVSSGRGNVVLFGLSVVVSIFAVVVNGRIFAGEPSWKNGGLLLIWILMAVLWVRNTIRHFRTSHLVSVDENGVRIQRTVGKREWPEERVIAVTSDQIQFHLFTKKDEISVSKKKVPPELAGELTKRSEK